SHGTPLRPTASLLLPAGRSLRWLACSAVNTFPNHRGLRAAMDPLAVALHDSDPGVRREAALALGRVGDNRAVDPLLRALAHRKGSNQIPLIEALGYLSHPRAAQWLCRCVEESEFAAQSAAEESLVRQGVAALPAILDRFQAPSLRTEALLISVAGQLGVAAVAPLCALLEDRRGYVRARAALTLARIAARCPAVQLRAALPILRKLHGRWPSPAERVAYQVALDRIEEATSELQYLPLPGQAVCLSPRNLPVPGRTDEAD
ncbi:MAG: hypothetical protein FJX77_11160, partial [Armatimonadetes bacterium]|nr:hypothetical protein [Armatimonadota bacterium]